MGIRTLKGFNEKLRLRGFLAYGTRDNKLKYGAGVDFFINRKAWSQIHVDYKFDIEQLGTSNSAISQQNLLTSLFRSRPLNQLNAVEEYSVGWEHWWREGFSNKITLRHRSLSSVSDGLKFEELNEKNET